MAFGILVVIALAGFSFLGSLSWSWWFMAIPVVTTLLGSWSVFRADICLVPLSTKCISIMEKHGSRSYLRFYVFGICVLDLHLNR